MRGVQTGGRERHGWDVTRSRDLRREEDRDEDTDRDATPVQCNICMTLWFGTVACGGWSQASTVH